MSDLLNYKFEFLIYQCFYLIHFICNAFLYGSHSHIARGLCWKCCLLLCSLQQQLYIHQHTDIILSFSSLPPTAPALPLMYVCVRVYVSLLSRVSLRMCVCVWVHTRCCAELTHPKWFLLCCVSVDVAPIQGLFVGIVVDGARVNAFRSRATGVCVGLLFL